MSTKRRPKHRPADGLTASEVRFCELFARGSDNSTQAYIDAGFPCKLSPSGEVDRGNTRARAWILLRKVDIQRRIRAFRGHATEAAGITTDLLAASLKHEAFFPRRSVFHKRTGRVLPPSKWPPEVDAFITGFDVKETTKIVRDPDTGRAVMDPKTMRAERATVVEYKIRFTAPTEAKRVLAQWLGMIGDRVAVEERGQSTIMTVLLDPTPTDQCDTPFPEDDAEESDGFGAAEPVCEPAEGVA